MSGQSKIPWTQETWEVTGGCTPISTGCQNCYAIPVVGNRLAKNPGFGDRYHDLVKNKKWTGTVKLFEDRLTQPLHWRAARKIFVCPRSDLFHEDIPFEFIDKVFAVMALCPQQTFQMLTKRHERRREYFKDLAVRVFCRDEGEGEIEEYLITQLLQGDCSPYLEKICRSWLDKWNARHLGWPLPNVWQGSTICNQKEADKHIPTLLQTPSAVRFVSVEPMLSPVNLFETSIGQAIGPCGESGKYKCNCDCCCGIPSLDWVIIGGESGGNRRRCDPRWVIDLVEQCKAAGVNVFVKLMDVDGKVSKESSEWPEVCREQVYAK